MAAERRGNGEPLAENGALRRRLLVVDVHIASLRQNLERNSPTPEFILTVHGMGYEFVG